MPANALNCGDEMICGRCRDTVATGMAINCAPAAAALNNSAAPVTAIAARFNRCFIKADLATVRARRTPWTTA